MDNKHADLYADAGPFIAVFNIVTFYLGVAIVYMLLT